MYVLGIIKHKAPDDLTTPSEQSRDDVHFYSWGEEEMRSGANQVAKKSQLSDHTQPLTTPLDISTTLDLCSRSSGLF